MRKSRIKELKNLLATMLTEDQLQELAAWSLIKGGAAFLLDLENQLKGDELSMAANSVWDCWRSEGTVRPAPSAPSASKLLAGWAELCERWMDAVESSSDMEGRYSGERRHWETPWWDSSLLMSDLDEIAALMKPLVDDVFSNGGPFPFSFEAIELVRLGLPEWVNGFGESPQVAPEMVAVTLRWEWLASHRESTRFVEVVSDLNELFGDYDVDDRGADIFVETLDIEERKDLFEAISRADDWPFPDLYLNLAEQCDPTIWLGLSQQEVSRNWRLGMPVLQDCVQREDWSGAKEVSAAMLSSCLGPDQIALSETLLLRRMQRPLLQADEAFRELLSQWQEAATRSADQPLATILECQRLVLRHQFDWDALLPALQGGAVFKLREDWISLVEESHNGGRDPASHWIGVLVRGMFAQPVAEITHQLLRKIEDFPIAERGNLQALAMLTSDLLSLSQKLPQLLNLCNSICKSETYAAERRKWLSRLDVKVLTEAVLERWRSHCRSLLPNPKNYTSHYQECVRWMAALSELDLPATA